jgi:hypothetical protein
MIDVKDLMCGNWLYNNVLGHAYKLGNIPHWLREEEHDPIPVTVDILKRIGFEEYEDLPLEGKFYRYWDKEGKYKLDVRDFWTNSQRKWYVHVDNDVCNTIGSGEFDYVHELQNLVRVITGHSLPITKDMLYGLGNES